eukprot:COSAG05_NODE_5080_length_1269_cov_2.019658_1_plen_302_part_01
MNGQTRRRRATAPDGATLQPRGRRRGSVVAWSPDTLHLTTYQRWPSFPWQSGECVGRAGRAQSRPSEIPAWKPPNRGEDDDPDLPVWWIVFQMGGFWAPQWVTGGLLGGILIPFRLIDLVGEDHKAHALALTTVFSTIVNLCGPLAGAASDATPYTSTFGRRRPYILVGMLGVCASIYMMKVAATYATFMVGWILFCIGNNLAQPAYGCLLPELIPERQRNLGSGIFVFFQVTGALVSSGLGLLIGRRTISDDASYWILIGIEVFSLVTGMISMGRRPGLWQPERPPLAVATTQKAKEYQQE